MSARRADAAAPWFVLPYGAAKGLKGTLKATCRILAFGAWRHSAQLRRGTVTRFTRNKMNYLLDRMHECLVCTHPAPLPTMVCNPSRLCGREMLRIEAHRGHETPEWGSGTMHSRQAQG
jgi:hypothetical protein